MDDASSISSPTKASSDARHLPPMSTTSSEALLTRLNSLLERRTINSRHNLSLSSFADLSAIHRNPSVPDIGMESHLPRTMQLENENLALRRLFEERGTGPPLGPGAEEILREVAALRLQVEQLQRQRRSDHFDSESLPGYYSAMGA